MSTQEPEAMDRLRQAFWHDGAAQNALADITDRGQALELVVAQARTWNLAIEVDDLRHVLRPDPVGLEGLRPRSVTGSQPPSRQWLPCAIFHDGREWVVDWAFFGSEKLTAPFFEEQLRQARNRTITQLLRPRTPLSALIADGGPDSPPLDGLVFHMSRCGSTLVAQMLGALDGSVVLSEPAPLDALLQLLYRDDQLPLETKIALLRGAVSALTADRDGTTRRRFIKTDSWHTAALPLFLAAFPETPWIFLYRDPLAVMLSQSRMPGAQTLPGGYSSLLNLDITGAIPGPHFTARVLAAICDAAADHAGLGRSLFVAYEDLPEAFATRILPHFDVLATQEERAATAAASMRDAKMPRAVFDPALRHASDGESEPLRSVVERELSFAIAKIAALAS